MEYLTLGRTGLRVSHIGFGGAPIGIPGYLGHEDRDGASFRSEAIGAIHAAVDCGINYFDTAPAYGEGRSESMLGEALAGSRDRVVLATKYTFRDGQAPAEYTSKLRESLAHLRTDHVEILQFHGSFFDDAVAEQILSSGVLEWAESMRAEGLCRYLGITAEGPSGGLERLLNTGRFDTLLIAYSVIHQSACDYLWAPFGVIPLAKSLDMGIIAMRPTTCGVLQKLIASEFPEIDRGRVTRLAIKFALSTPEVDCVLVGMKNRGEVEANIELAEDSSMRLDLKQIHNRFD